MRTIILGIGLLAVPAVAAAPAQQPLKDFEFRGFVAGVPLTAEQKGQCKELLKSVLSCSIDDRKVAGIDAMSVDVFVSNDKLSNVSIRYDPIFFGVLTDAFKQKYGKPCRSTIEKWVGELGNSRSNPTMTWCFKSGKLVAKMYGVLLDVSEVDYDDSNKATGPAAKPKIDF